MISPLQWMFIITCIIKFIAMGGERHCKRERPVTSRLFACGVDTCTKAMMRRTQVLPTLAYSTQTHIPLRRRLSCTSMSSPPIQFCAALLMFLPMCSRCSAVPQSLQAFCGHRGEQQGESANHVRRCDMSCNAKFVCCGRAECTSLRVYRYLYGPAAERCSIRLTAALSVSWTPTLTVHSHLPLQEHTTNGD
jgi:hypothetical protein